MFYHLVPNFLPQTGSWLPFGERAVRLNSRSLDPRQTPGSALLFAASTRNLYAHVPAASSLALVSLPSSFFSVYVGGDIVIILWKWAAGTFHLHEFFGSVSLYWAELERQERQLHPVLSLASCGQVWL